jgi:hypothetical protein
VNVLCVTTAIKEKQRKVAERGLQEQVVSYMAVLCNLLVSNKNEHNTIK